MPTVAYIRRSRPRDAVVRCWRTCSTRSFIFEIRVRMIRRSVSSWLSPGPRVPIPPPVRDRCVQRRVRRGSWYSSWASSTWSRPSWVCACWAKMSRISRLRSMTLTFRRPSSAFCWPGDSSSSAMRISKPVSLFACASSSALPLPTYQFGSTWRRFCHSAPTTSAPAVTASAASSFRLSSAVQPASSPVSTATRKAFSTGGARSIGARGLMGAVAYPAPSPAPPFAPVQGALADARRSHSEGRSMTDTDHLPPEYVAALEGTPPPADQDAFAEPSEVEHPEPRTDTEIYEGDIESGAVPAWDDVLDELSTLTDRPGETDDPNVAAEEGEAWIPPVDPPVVADASAPGGAVVAAGFGTTALDEPFDADHHGEALSEDDEVTARVREALLADARTSRLADRVD